MYRRLAGYYTRYLYSDLAAGLVLFLVALPLCLGIALAMGAPPLSGLIGGMIGGVVVCLLSGSQLGVSGPANGVAVTSAAAIASYGYGGFLAALMIAGLMQIALGMLRAGSLSAYFPSAVLNGVLSAIGLMLILKQIPHALGLSYDAQDDVAFLDRGGALDVSTFQMQGTVSVGALLLSVSSLALLFFWEARHGRKPSGLSLAPAALVVVIYGLVFNLLTRAFAPDIAIATEHLISLPTFDSAAEIRSALVFPDFSQLGDMAILKTAISLALITSMESLLALEATEKLDPLKRTVSGDRELLAQGVGNLLSGLVGGTPVSGVIVRSSVNINAGAHTKASSLTHGVLLLGSVFFLAPLLNSVPLSTLAAILIHTGYKLTKPSLYLDIYARGRSQFIPFVVTVFTALTFDLVTGIGVGLAVGLFFVMRNNFHSALTLTQHESSYLLRLRKDVSFLNKAPLRKILNSLDDGSSILIDGTRADYVDIEILETFEDFQKAAAARDIKVEFKNVRGIGAAGAKGAAPGAPSRSLVDPHGV
jgi:MFS superfamily sulfate permease-like transporter